MCSRSLVEVSKRKCCFFHIPEPRNMPQALKGDLLLILQLRHFHVSGNPIGLAIILFATARPCSPLAHEEAKLRVTLCKVFTSKAQTIQRLCAMECAS